MASVHVFNCLRIISHGIIDVPSSENVHEMSFKWYKWNNIGYDPCKSSENVIFRVLRKFYLSERVMPATCIVIVRNSCLNNITKQKGLKAVDSFLRGYYSSGKFQPSIHDEPNTFLLYTCDIDRFSRDFDVAVKDW